MSKKRQSKDDAFRKVVKALKDDPILFVRKIIGVEPTPQQQRLLLSVRDNRATAVKSGHGTGKTATLSWIILWFITTHEECTVAVTAPTAHQLRNILWVELEKWFNRSLLSNWISMHKQRIWWTQNEEKRYGFHVSVAKPENLQGVHSKNVLYIIDEIGGLNPVLMPVIEGAMTTLNTKIVGTGNPTRTDGILFEAFNSQKAFWNTLTFSSADSPNVENEYVKMVGDKYGYDSDIFRVRVLGEFPNKSSDSLIEISALYDALHRELLDFSASNIYIGVDVARYGDDSSSVVIRNEREVIEIKEFRELDTMTLSGEVIKSYNEYVKDYKCGIYIDGIGVGAGVVDRLKELKYPVFDVVVSKKPTRDYVNVAENLKAELWIRMKEWIDTASFKSDNERLISELGSVKYEITSNGKITMEKKEAYKKRIGSSPDVGDALALTMVQGRPDRVIMTGSTKYKDNRGY